MRELLEIMEKLRDPEGGCPWDLEQNYRSIVPHTIEEAYEVAEAIETGDYDGLKGELGDLLFQVVFYAQLAKEEGRYDFSDIVRSVCEKMVRRHPHVFAGELIETEQQQRESWEKIKLQERAASSETGVSVSKLDGISHAQPAITLAGKLQRRATEVGFGGHDREEVLDLVWEELDDLTRAIDEMPDARKIEEQFGDLLFNCVNLSRQLNLNAESALRGASRRFEARFHDLERKIAPDCSSEPISFEERESLWGESGSENES